MVVVAQMRANGSSQLRIAPPQAGQRGWRQRHHECIKIEGTHSLLRAVDPYPQASILGRLDGLDNRPRAQGRSHSVGQRSHEPFIATGQGIHRTIAGVIDEQIIESEESARLMRLGSEVAVALHGREPARDRIVELAEHVLERSSAPWVIVVLRLSCLRIPLRRSQPCALVPEPPELVHPSCPNQCLEAGVVINDLIACHEVRGAGQRARLEP